jgi:hypothetical protein
MSDSLQITLYSKPACSLCDELHDDLVWLQSELEFTVVTKEIGSDPVLVAQFQYLVPVLEIAGVLYYPPHDLLQLRQRLVAAVRAEAAP